MPDPVTVGLATAAIATTPVGWFGGICIGFMVFINMILIIISFNSNIGVSRFRRTS